jgi:copper chaperone CopZ
MKRKAMVAFGLLLSMLLVFALVQPALATEKTVKLSVHGCGCPEDERTITITGQQMKGVKSAQASFISGTVTITYDESETTVKQIIENYKRAGMSVVGDPQWVK